MFESKKFDERDENDKLEEFTKMTSDWDEFQDDDVSSFDKSSNHIDSIKLDPQY